MWLITRGPFDTYPLSTTTKFTSTTSAKVTFQIVNILQGQGIPQLAAKISTVAPATKSTAKTMPTTTQSSRRTTATTKKATKTTMKSSTKSLTIIKH